MIERHFEIIFETVVLLVVFVLGALLLAWFPENEQLSNWITGGIVIGVLARAFQTNGKNGGSDVGQPGHK